MQELRIPPITRWSQVSEEGYLWSIFSSYQGEGGSVAGSCLGKRQIFVRFSGCNLAQGSMGTRGCIYCDTPESNDQKASFVRFQQIPGSKEFEKLENPLNAEEASRVIQGLKTSDLHSVSLTGGEPLFQPRFLAELARELNGKGMRTYLETNGSLPQNLGVVSKHIDFACVDVKDRSAKAAEDWNHLIDRELESIGILSESGAKVFGKLVVTSQTRPEDAGMVASALSELDCPLNIQVVTPVKGVKRPSQGLIFSLTEAASKHLQPELISISVQIHKELGLP